MAKIVWIASYPKSGNTWVRFLIANLLNSAVKTSAEVEALIPDSHKPLRTEYLDRTGLLFIKTHDRYSAEFPLRSHTVGTIYIARDPLDVIASNLNYLHLRPDFLAASADQRGAMEATYVRRFIEAGGDPRWQSLGRGTWSENVASWLGEAMPFPRITVRYKDLKADPVSFLARVCTFVGLTDKTPADLENAARNASFDKMRAMEEHEIAHGIPGFFLDEHQAARADDGSRFLNRGETGSYRRVLTEDEIHAARRRFAPVMARLGFDA